MSNAVTLVSLAPFPLHIEMPGCIPASYDLPESDTKNMKVLNIVDARSMFYIDADRGTLQLHRPADYIAGDIVRHYKSGSIFTVPPSAEYPIGGYPCIFFVEGRHDVASIVASFGDKLAEERRSQDLWLTNLVKIADDLWQMNRQHRAISDIQRKAARILSLKREWAEKPDPASTVECLFCTSLISRRAVVCPICGNTVDPTSLALLQEKLKTVVGGDLNLPTPVKPAPLG